MVKLLKNIAFLVVFNPLNSFSNDSLKTNVFERNIETVSSYSTRRFVSNGIQTFFGAENNQKFFYGAGFGIVIINDFYYESLENMYKAPIYAKVKYKPIPKNNFFITSEIGFYYGIEQLKLFFAFLNVDRSPFIKTGIGKEFKIKKRTYYYQLKHTFHKERVKFTRDFSSGQIISDWYRSNGIEFNFGIKI